MLHLKTKRTGLNAVAYSPCGRWLAGTGTGGAHVWDLHDPGAAPWHPAAGDARFPTASGAAFLADGRLFMSEWRGFRLADPGTRAAATHSLGRTHYGLRTSPDGRWLTEYGRTPVVWRRTADGALLAAWEDARRWGGTAAFSPDSRRFAASSPGGRDRPPTVTVHDTADWGGTSALLPVYQYAERLLFSPDGNTLVAGSGRGLAVYDLRHPGKRPKRVSNPGPSHVRAAAFAPDGRRFATVSGDQAVRLWDTASWQPAQTFAWDVGKIQGVAFSPGGSTAAAATSGGRVVVWDLDG